MKKRVRILVVLIALAMLFSLIAGCGSGTSGTQNSPVSSTAASPSAAVSSAPASPESSPESVAATRSDTLVLRLGTNHSTGTAVAQACQEFADSVNEKTGGGIKIEVYPDGTLGNETALRDACSSGSIDIVALGAGVLGAYANAANLPVSNFVWDSEEEMKEVLLGELGQKYINDPVEKAAGIHVIYGWPQAARELLTKDPVTSLSDLKGMKIRVPAGNSLYVDTWDGYGAISVSLSMNECYTALEQGVIDGLEMPIDSLYTGGYHEVAKYLALTNHMMYLQYILINSETWGSLSAEEQQIVRDCCVEAEAYHNQIRDEKITTMLDDMKAKGVTVTEIDTAEWRAATEPTSEKWMDNWGQEVYDAFTGYSK
jgi:tripartite ATP-independent transporter DctP family solute receptor